MTIKAVKRTQIIPTSCPSTFLVERDEHDKEMLESAYEAYKHLNDYGMGLILGAELWSRFSAAYEDLKIKGRNNDRT